MAALDCDFEAETHTLTIRRRGRQVARGRLDTWLGRSVVEQFFSAYCADELKGPPLIVRAPGHSFSDKAQKCVHIVNLATVWELERSVGRPIDPLRFRANIYVEGVKPWDEFGWEGKEILIGRAVLRFIDCTARCDATNVDPKSGARDMSIPSHLQRTLGHGKLGVYATVIAAGELRPGDPVRVDG